MSARDLADLAAAIARAEALVAADATPQADRANAIERIADIAFVLHERNVEASLCDALDAAVREVTDAGSRNEARVRRIRQAAELLHEVSERVNEMIARADGALSAELPETPPAASELLSAGSVGDTDDVGAELPLDGLFATDGRENDEIAEFLHEAMMPPTSTDEEANSNKTALNETTSGTASSGKDPSVGGMAVSRTSPMDAPRPALNPEDDPGDLFEPTASAPLVALPQQKIEAAPLSASVQADVQADMRVPEQTAAAAGEGIPQREEDRPPLAPSSKSGNVGDVSSAAAPAPPASPHIDTGPSQSGLRATPSDPLAPVRALSVEEMIALFS